MISALHFNKFRIYPVRLKTGMIFIRWTYLFQIQVIDPFCKINCMWISHTNAGKFMLCTVDHDL